MSDASRREREGPGDGGRRSEERVPCAVCGEARPRRKLRPAGSLGRLVDGPPDALVCDACHERERLGYVVRRLESERGELSEVEADVARKAADHAIVAASLEESIASGATLGQRVADRMARIGGSWTFIAVFFAFLAAWMAWNTAILRGGAFDPYPYVLLNLVLSCLAAVQAPIILMAQNRMASRDRAQADQDFRTNLKAEIEIVGLHEKVDHLLHAQYERLVELQELELELLEEIAARRKG